jgi:hypothetical protein
MNVTKRQDFNAFSCFCQWRNSFLNNSEIKFLFILILFRVLKSEQNRKDQISAFWDWNNHEFSFENHFIIDIIFSMFEIPPLHDLRIEWSAFTRSSISIIWGEAIENQRKIDQCQDSFWFFIQEFPIIEIIPSENNVAFPDLTDEIIKILNNLKHLNQKFLATIYFLQKFFQDSL